MKHFPLIALVLAASAGCGISNRSPLRANGRGSAAGWSIEFSPGMPSQPTSASPGAWYFDFPADPNYPACIPNPHENCNSVNYVTNSYNGETLSAVSMTFQIVTTGNPTFNYTMETDNTCATPATVRLFLERRGDDSSQEFYRWWANPIAYQLQTMADAITMTVPLTPDQWSSVYGKTGTHDAEAGAGFRDALKNLGRVGMTFGGGCFFGHGVNVSGGSARFALLSYTVS